MHRITKGLPIGVFDSGVGGLTVLQALKQHLPDESYIYLGDTARLPYGIKSADTVIRYAIRATKLLLQRKIKLLVVACNTVTALALPSLQHNFASIAIRGVIEPGAKAAIAASKTGHIAVIATEATVKARGYHQAILQLLPTAVVEAQACQLLVSLTEEGWTDGEIVEAVARRYLEPLIQANQQHQKPIDSLILGCTHFPVLAKPIKKIVGNSITVVDSAQTTAHEVKETLQSYDLQYEGSVKPHTTFLVTDSPDRFARFAKFFLGEPITEADIKLVDL